MLKLGREIEFLIHTLALLCLANCMAKGKMKAWKGRFCNGMAGPLEFLESGWAPSASWTLSTHHWWQPMPLILWREHCLMLSSSWCFCSNWSKFWYTPEFPLFLNVRWHFVTNITFTPVLTQSYLNKLMIASAGDTTNHCTTYFCQGFKYNVWKEN